MPSLPPPAFAPPGSEAIERWAKARSLTFQRFPSEEWFRAWEPFETLVSAGAYYHAVSWTRPAANVTVVEPWYASPGSEPLGRTLLLFISHAAFRRHAAIRGGEHFNTRVAYLESAPMPRVSVGDPRWDGAVATFAASGAEAAAAFPPKLRHLLERWAFVGHLEVRPGGVVAHFAGTEPTPDGYGKLLAAAPELIAAARVTGVDP